MKIIVYLILTFLIGCSSHEPGRYIYLNSGTDINNIAKKFNTSVKNIKAANPQKSLTPGNWIFVPYEGRVLLSGSGNIQSRYGNKMFSWPVPSSKAISSYYGKRRGRFHDGLDISAPKGTHIIAAADGKVLFNGRLRGYGKVVIISHSNNFHTVYAHLNRSFAAKGDRVAEGEIIAQVGMTGKTSGPHLHFEVRFKNKILNPVHYMKWLPSNTLARK